MAPISLVLFIIAVSLITANRFGSAFRVTFDNLTFVMSNIEPLKDSNALHEDHPKKCYYRPTNHTWGVGESWSPRDKCWVARCVSPGVVVMYDCGVVSPALDGHTNKYCQSVGRDLQRAYPRCCNRYLCRSPLHNMRPHIYNPVVAGGDREVPSFKPIKSRKQLGYSFLKKWFHHNETCHYNQFRIYK